jgi:hypothetical protein
MGCNGFLFRSRSENKKTLNFAAETRHGGRKRDRRPVHFLFIGGLNSTIEPSGRSIAACPAT